MRAHNLRERGDDDMKSITRTISIAILFFVAALTFADTVNVSGVTSWSYVDSHTFVLYSGSRAVCMVKVWEYIFRTSEISILKSMISSYDDKSILIDGKLASIRNVERL